MITPASSATWVTPVKVPSHDDELGASTRLVLSEFTTTKKSPPMVPRNVTSVDLAAAEGHDAAAARAPAR